MKRSTIKNNTSIYVDKQAELFMVEARTILDQFNNDVNKDINSSPPLIYHYTTIETLLKILKSKVLYFTDYKCLNDEIEIKYGSELVKKCLSEHKDSIQNDPLYSFFCEGEEKIFNDISKTGIRVYICSFCRNHDYLPAWRYYGNNGFGVSIGFEFKESNNESDPFPKSITKIIYDQNEAEKWIKKLIVLSKKYMDRMRKYLDTTNRSKMAKCKIIDRLESRLCANLLTLLPSIKHHDYRTEEEIRLFYSEIINSDGTSINPIPSEKIFNIDPMENVCKHCGIPPKGVNKNKKTGIKLNFEIDEIREIWTGPSCNHSDAEKKIKNELKKNLFSPEKIKIKQSNILYRG